MARRALIFLSVIVLLSASFYQLVVKDFIFISLGIGRVTQSIGEFPYSCRRLEQERLQACEDLWLDEDARVLYAACTGTKHRMAWSQPMGKFNISGRRPGGSELIALNIDSPGNDGLFDMQIIKPQGYTGAAGNGELDFVGFDARILPSSNIRFYFTNHRPPVDADNKYMDATMVGANTTIEVFELKRGGKRMNHLQTVATTKIWAANRVAVLDDGAFLVTNDHSAKVGLRKELDPLLGGGNVVYCSFSGACHSAANTRFWFPNGLTKGTDGLIYVPSSLDGSIRVFELQSNRMLKEVDIIHTRMPLDNISPDANGDIWAPGFPVLSKCMKAFEQPFGHSGPSTVFRIRKVDGRYLVEKVLEDGEGEVLSGVTTVRHDVRTGRLFLGAACSPYIMVCDPK